MRDSLKKMLFFFAFALLMGLSPAYSKIDNVTTSFMHSVGDSLYALTDDYYSYDELDDIDEFFQKQGDKFHVASYSEIDVSKLKELFTYDYLLVKEGLLDVYAGKLCERTSLGDVEIWKCKGKAFALDSKHKVLLIGENQSEDLNVDLPFCKKRCYDARAILKSGPVDWDYSQGNKEYVLQIKKGLIIRGIIRPYGEGCFLQGPLSVCVDGGNLTISFSYPDGQTYYVSAPVQMKYWNTFRATINPNLIGLFVRQHGSDKREFNYADLVYKPVDNDKIGYVYKVKVVAKRITNDPYEWVRFRIESGEAKSPFCGEQVAFCLYNFLNTHAWKEGERIYYGAVLAKNINYYQASSAIYRRNGTYEVKFNTGDLYVGNDDKKAGIIGYWKGKDGSFGVYQLDYKDNFVEKYGYEINYSTLTPEKVGFFREKKDYASYFYGFESNRKRNWIVNKIPYPALWEDTGKKLDVNDCSVNVGGKCATVPQSVSCPAGYTYMDDRCVKQIECPEGGYYNPQTNRCEKQPTCRLKIKDLNPYIVGLYEVGLGRKPEISGFMYWQTSWGMSVPDYDKVLSLIRAARENGEVICGKHSSELSDKALKIISAYLWYVGRCPDPEGFSYWLNDPNFNLETFKAAADEKEPGKHPNPPYIVDCPMGYEREGEFCVSTPCANPGEADIACGSYSYDKSANICYKTDVCEPGDKLDPVKDYCYNTNFSATCPDGTTYDKNTGYCISKTAYGKVVTDDGVFEEKYNLCPKGQVELYQGEGKDFEGKCFTYKEKADCYKGRVNGLDEDRFGNYCYLQLKRPPDVCPSDGRSYTLLRPPKADYVCETTRRPVCDWGDYRRGDKCYYQTNPRCPLPHGQLSGGTCKGWVSASCPSGYFLNTYTDRCERTTSPHCYGGTVRDGGSCYYTKDKECPWWTVEQPDGRCKSKYCDDDEDDSYCYYDKECPSGYYYKDSIGKCVRYANSACSFGYYYDSSRDVCVEETYPSCPYGYYYNYSTDRCERAIDACSYEAIGRYGYSYDYSTGKCLKYKENACRNRSSYSDWSYDSSRDICYHREPAECYQGEKKRDPDTGWSACYEKETQTTSYYPSASKTDPGRIYCRNGYYYWKDRCYKLEGTACEGNYYSLKRRNELVVLGWGNRYDEWTGKCWVKIQDACGAGSYPLRGEFTSEIHCLKKKKDLSKNVFEPDVKEFSLELCNYLAKTNFNTSCNVTVNPLMHDAHSIADVKYNPVCPLDPNSQCIDVGGQMQLCGTNKICIGCGDYDLISQNLGYSMFQKVHYEGDKAYGISWFEMPPTYIQQTVANAGGRLPKKSEVSKFKEFFNISDIWYEGDGDLENPDVKKYLGIVWEDPNKVGFLGICITDDNGDGLCTADMVECYRQGGKWICPYGQDYPCQPYEGKYYCSKYSDTCRNMSNPEYAMQNTDTPQGINDKKNDGEVDENGCKGTVYIFNGRDLRCRPPGFQTGFSDCCKKTKTWFGLGYCNQSEKELAALRSWGKLDGQCHYVGKYCAVKVLGICLQKKKTYCCFNSVLARIVQEQGREQLGLDWGSPKSPNCRGFTPEEFQKLDFSKMDFSEWYSDLQKRIDKNFKQFKQNVGKQITNYFNEVVSK